MDNFYLQVVDQDPAASDWGWGKKKKFIRNKLVSEERRKSWP